MQCSMLEANARSPQQASSRCASGRRCPPLPSDRCCGHMASTSRAHFPATDIPPAAPSRPTSSASEWLARRGLGPRLAPRWQSRILSPPAVGWTVRSFLLCERKAPIGSRSFALGLARATPRSFACRHPAMQLGWCPSCCYLGQLTREKGQEKRWGPPLCAAEHEKSAPQFAWILVW